MLKLQRTRRKAAGADAVKTTYRGDEANRVHPIFADSRRFAPRPEVLTAGRGPAPLWRVEPMAAVAGAVAEDRGTAGAMGVMGGVAWG